MFYFCVRVFALFSENYELKIRREVRNAREILEYNRKTIRAILKDLPHDIYKHLLLKLHALVDEKSQYR